MAKLRPEEVVTMSILHTQGESHAQIARRFLVTEGAVRYRLKREGVPDGRTRQAAKADGFAPMIEAFMQATADAPRERNQRALYDDLCARGYDGSYSRLTKWIRGRYPGAPVRPFRRVETPPGAQSQSDWMEASFFFEDTHSVRKVYGLLIKLSHSRGRALVWFDSMDMPAWLHGHNECYARLGGVPAIERIDNLKTGVASGAGPWARLHPAFRAYAKELGFHIEACRPRTPTDKGKVERDVRTARSLGLPESLRDLCQLQAETDGGMERLMRRLICPSTGKTVALSLQDERVLLRPLPEPMPVPFTTAVIRTVEKDCTIRFLGRQFTVPFLNVGRRVEARDCVDGLVRIFADGRMVAALPRGERGMLMHDPAHYEGAGTARIIPPVPLGKVGRLLASLKAEGVQHRSVEIYARLSEVMSCAR